MASTRADAGHGFVCVEGAYERPTDRFLETLEWPAFFYNQSVYFYGRLQAPDAWRWWGGALWRPDIALITRTTPSRLVDRATLSGLDITELVAGTRAVVIGAWDDEGLIFWEPSSG